MVCQITLVAENVSILKDCALEISKCQAICGSVICMERTRGGWLIQREGELLEEIRTGDPLDAWASLASWFSHRHLVQYIWERHSAAMLALAITLATNLETWLLKRMQTERQRLVLSDTSKSPIESIRAGGRYDFI